MWRGNNPCSSGKMKHLKRSIHNMYLHRDVLRSLRRRPQVTCVAWTKLPVRLHHLFHSHIRCTIHLSNYTAYFLSCRWSISSVSCYHHFFKFISIYNVKRPLINQHKPCNFPSYMPLITRPGSIWLCP